MRNVIQKEISNLMDKLDTLGESGGDPSFDFDQVCNEEAHLHSQISILLKVLAEGQ
jgi:hypothetical protein